MPALNAISADKLLRLVGTPAAPLIVDVRGSSSQLLPASVHRSADEVAAWADALPLEPVVGS